MKKGILDSANILMRFLIIIGMIMPMNKTAILLIPGNPSVPGIYEPFLDNLIESLNWKDQVYSRVLHHLGQCNQKHVKRPKITVRDVVEDHKQTIQQIISQERPDQIYLIGHSLGSAITVELYQEFENTIDHFMVLCPFLGPSKQNQNYLKLFRNPVSRLGMKGITYGALKSQRLSQEIFKRWLGDNPFNTHIPKEISKPYYIKNFFSLVSNYFEDFEVLQTREKVGKMNPEKAFFLLAEKDYWVPPETLNYLPKGSTILETSKIPHDFCLKEDHYSFVSQTLSEHLHNIRRQK